MDYPEDPRWRELFEAARDVRGSDSLDALDRLEDAVRSFDPPKPKRHTFGGVVFEETGRFREPSVGEWFLMEDEPACLPPGDHAMPHPILRPVALEFTDE